MKPNTPQDRIIDRIIRQLERVGRSPVDRSRLLRVATTLGERPSAVMQALEFLVLRGKVRRIGDLYTRLPHRFDR